MTNRQGIIRSHQASFSLIYRFIDFIIIISSLHLMLLLRKLSWTEHFLLISLIGAGVYLFLAESAGLYRSWRAGSFRTLLLLTLSCWGGACVALLMLAYFSKFGVAYSRLVIGGWFLSSLVALLAWRYMFRLFLGFIRGRGYNSRTVAIIGASMQGKELGLNVLSQKYLGMNLIGYFDDRSPDRIKSELPADIMGGIDDAIELAKQGKVDLIYIVLPMKAEERIACILERCADTTATVHIVPDFFVYNLLHARWCHVGSMSTLSVYDTPFYGVNSWLKRVEDVVLASLILCFIALPMLIISMAIKLTSKGPVIFKQHRYGLDGERINVWKFRSMTTTDNGDQVVQASKNDARVTPLGAFLRRTSLDELPQFINVIQGRMSIVGPRPHAVTHNEEYRTLVNGYMLRHKVKPGITGWAQINGWRGETDTLDKMEKRVEFDLKYIRSWSVRFDLKIILLTVFKGFVGKNAY